MSAHIMFSMRKPWDTHGFHYILLAMSGYSAQGTKTKDYENQSTVKFCPFRNQYVMADNKI